MLVFSLLSILKSYLLTFYRAIITLKGVIKLTNDFNLSRKVVEEIKAQVTEMKPHVKDNQGLFCYYQGKPVIQIGYTNNNLVILFHPNLTGSCNRTILHVTNLELSLTIEDLQPSQVSKPIGFL